MLDPRLYRDALLPILVAVIAFAFSLKDRPAPVGAGLAPAAFVGERAALDLRALAARYPDRRPGSAGDDALAAAVQRRLAAAGAMWRVTRVRAPGETIDGVRMLTTILARQAGAPGPQLVVVSHRDAAGRGAAAELSGTAAMLELAHDLTGRRTRRTIVLASTSGGSGGAAGVREVLRSIEGRVAAVLVLGDLAGRKQTPPYVVGWSADGGQSALRLRRTVQAALARETGMRVRSEDAMTQWARLAAPFAVGEQGPVAAAGVPAALVSLTGERPPPADDPLDDRRLQAMGRGVLRAVTALDAAPPPPAGADRDLETLRKAVPEWAVRVLVGVLLLAPALVAIDALARARRRRRAVAPWLGWILATGGVVLVTLLFARTLGLVGLLGPATAPPAPPGAIAVDRTGWAGLAAVGLAFALLALALRPLLLRLVGAAGRVPDDGAGVAMVAGLVTVALAMWVADPYAALLLVPAAHLWLLVASPEAPLPRPARLALVAAGLAPAVWLVVTLAGVLGVGPGDGAWWVLLALAGGQGAVLGWLLWSLGAGCAALAVVLALRRRPAPPPAPVRRPVPEPLAYTGPRPRAATESALHR